MSYWVRALEVEKLLGDLEWSALVGIDEQRISLAGPARTSRGVPTYGRTAAADDDYISRGVGRGAPGDDVPHLPQ